ncbi:capsid protein [Tick-associated circular DNA virus]|nr:capsid protein [Tick-associated circular DNA virus]
MDHYRTPTINNLRIGFIISSLSSIHSIPIPISRKGKMHKCAVSMDHQNPMHVVTNTRIPYPIRNSLQSKLQFPLHTTVKSKTLNSNLPRNPNIPLLINKNTILLILCNQILHRRPPDSGLRNRIKKRGSFMHRTSNVRGRSIIVQLVTHPAHLVPSIQIAVRVTPHSQHPHNNRHLRLDLKLKGKPPKIDIICPTTLVCPNTRKNAHPVHRTLNHVHNDRTLKVPGERGRDTLRL